MYGFVNSGVCFFIYKVIMCCDSIGRFSVLLLMTNSRASSLVLDNGSGCLGGGPLEFFFNKIQGFATVFYDDDVIGEFMPGFSFGLFIKVDKDTPRVF